MSESVSLAHRVGYLLPYSFLMTQRSDIQFSSKDNTHWCNVDSVRSERKVLYSHQAGCPSMSESNICYPLEWHGNGQFGNTAVTAVITVLEVKIAVLLWCGFRPGSHSSFVRSLGKKSRLLSLAFSLARSDFCATGNSSAETYVFTY